MSHEQFFMGIQPNRGVVEFPWITRLQKSIRIVILSHVHNSTDIYIVYSMQYMHTLHTSPYMYIDYIDIEIYIVQYT